MPQHLIDQAALIDGLIVLMALTGLFVYWSLQRLQLYFDSFETGAQKRLSIASSSNGRDRSLR